jgi:hypothetical protein
VIKNDRKGAAGYEHRSLGVRGGARLERRQPGRGESAVSCRLEGKTAIVIGAAIGSRRRHDHDPRTRLSKELQ